MPDRIVRANILSSDVVNQLSWPAEVFYRRLMSIVDDFGRFDAKPSLLRASLYPLKIDKVSEPDVVKWLGECSKAGLVRQYTVNGKDYLEVLKFGQRLRAMKSKFPAPDSAVICQQMSADVSGCPPETKRNESETETEAEEKEAPSAPKSKLTFEEREKDFGQLLSEYLHHYGKDMIRQFFDYWREPNKSKTRMKWEQEKTWDLSLRLQRWSRNDKSFTRKEPVTTAITAKGDFL